MRKNLLTALAMAAVASNSAFAAQAPYDLLVRGGLVIDGTGAPGKRADVGVREGKIVFVGQAGPHAAAGEIIDAKGLVVAPGFIDAHNHVDGSVFYIRNIAKANADAPVLNEGFVTQGVTTIVGGPDGGYSPAGLRQVIGRFRQVGITTNYAFYIGHNGIRTEVMGSAHRKPTPDELAKMVSLTKEGMEMGAVGLSSGLMYEPGMFSDTSEVVALARAVKPFGGIYDSHVRDPVFSLLASDEEAIQIGREAGIPVKIAHEKAVGLINRGAMGQVIKLIEKERASGHQVVTDQYPYDGAATGPLLDLIVVPGATPRPDATPESHLSQVQVALRDPEQFPKIREASEKGINGGFTWIKAVGYGSMRVVDSKDFPELIGKNIELLAKERGIEPFALLSDLIQRSHGSTILTLGAMEENDVRALLKKPWNMIASDGYYVGKEAQVAQHPRSTGTFTRVLGRYSRDLGVLSLPQAVRKMTSLPADFLGLYDRGRIQVGKAADLTIFSAATVRDTSTWASPESLSQGVVDVIVGGKPVLKDGVFTGATPGTVIKRQSAPRPPDPAFPKNW